MLPSESISSISCLNEKDEELAAAREALTQRAHLLNEKDEELAGVREALTQRSLRIQELEKTLFEMGPEMIALNCNRGPSAAKKRTQVSLLATDDEMKPAAG